ncbi:hypothetical protein Tco_1143396 [Tanacetum coccineum]
MKVAINMDSSMGKMCLGKDVIEISSDQNEGLGDWDLPEYKDTAGSVGKKEPETLVFHKMYTEEDSDRYIAQCFVNGLYASDGEINLEMNDNLISNDYVVKLCLEYEVRKGKKLVKNELMVLLCGKIFFVQFVINPEEDEFEPGQIFGRSFLCSANAMINFGEGAITIQPDFDPFLLSSNEEKNPNLDDLETLLDFDIDEAPQTETDLSLLVRLDGMVTPEEERVMVKVKGQMLKEKRDPGAFIFPIRLEGQIDENALANTGSDTNTMPYKIYEQLGRNDIMKEERNITMINYTEAEVTGRLVNELCQVGFTTLSSKFLILEIPVDRDAPIVEDQKKIRITESDSDDEEDYVIKRNEMGTPIHNSQPIGYQNNTNPAENMTLSTLESIINPFRKISMWKKAVSFLGSLPANLRDVEWKPDYKMCYSNPELATRQWKTEIRLTDPYGNIYMQAFVTKPTKRKLYKYHKTSGAYDHEAGSSRAKRALESLYTVEEALLPDVHHKFLEWRGCSRKAKSRYNSRLVLKELNPKRRNILSIAWVRAFNIREPIYPELCREFYATYEFDEFARRLGLYHAEEYEPTVSSLNNDEIYFKISFDDSDDEDYIVIFDKNLFSYKIISTNDLKMNSENDNEKVNLPSLPSPEPTVSCFDDLDLFKDFENEIPAIVYNDALTSKSYFLTEPTGNDDDKVDIEHSSGDLSVKPLPDVINTDVGAYAHGREERGEIEEKKRSEKKKEKIEKEEKKGGREKRGEEGKRRIMRREESRKKRIGKERKRREDEREKMKNRKKERERERRNENKRRVGERRKEKEAREEERERERRKYEERKEEMKKERKKREGRRNRKYEDRQEKQKKEEKRSESRE